MIKSTPSSYQVSTRREQEKRRVELAHEIERFEGEASKCEYCLKRQAHTPDQHNQSLGDWYRKNGYGVTK